MASTGKLDVEMEVKIPADKFWQSIRDSTTLFPKAMPQEYKSIEVLEGDGKAVGSVWRIQFGEASPIVKVAKEKIESVDDEKKTLSYSVIDGDLLNFYKTFKATLVVTPNGGGSLVKWSCEFVKASDEVPDPNIIKDFAVKNFIDFEAFLKAQSGN